MVTLLMDGPVGQQKPKNVRFLFFNKNGQSPASFSYNFVFFQTNITFLQQINVKNVHPVPIRCWDSNPQPSEHESPAITTRPGLLPIRFLFMFFFKKGANPGLFLFIFILFSLQFQHKLKKSIDDVLGIRTLGRRMEGADKTTELSCLCLKRNFVCYQFCETQKTLMLPFASGTGNGCGSVGRAVASDNRDLRFESSLRKLCIC